MTLAGMIAVDENALICDFAETYHVFNYRELPLKTAAILASGLRDESRIKMKMAGAKITPERMLSAAIVDRLGLLIWLQTKDGRRGRKRPRSILDLLSNQMKEKDDIILYESGQAFADEWERLVGKEVR